MSSFRFFFNLICHDLLLEITVEHVFEAGVFRVLGDQEFDHLRVRHDFFRGNLISVPVRLDIDIADLFAAGHGHVAVKPGDRLWWASDTAAAGPGPSLVQARMDDDPIEAVQFDGQDVLVVSDRGRPEKIGEQYSCTDEASCIEWIKRNMPDAVLLKGQTVKAVHLDNCGNKNLIDLTCTVSEIERIFSSSSLASDSPDNEGTFAIYHEGANAENSQITTFLHDCMGNPVQAIYGEMLLVRDIDYPNDLCRVFPGRAIAGVSGLFPTAIFV